jgi:predicted DNA-binding protein YlxM (UPF0122 family)
MKKLREIIRLGVQLNLSRQAISRALKSSRRTISTYLERYKLLALSYEDFQQLTDLQLEEQFKDMERELKSPGVTLFLVV